MRTDAGDAVADILAMPAASLCYTVCSAAAPCPTALGSGREWTPWSAESTRNSFRFVTCPPPSVEYFGIEAIRGGGNEEGGCHPSLSERVGRCCPTLYYERRSSCTVAAAAAPPFFPRAAAGDKKRRVVIRYRHSVFLQHSKPGSEYVASAHCLIQQSHWGIGHK